MKPIYYYLSLFPTEAVIASNLDPESFAVYMSTGSKRGSSEPLIFVELKGDLTDIIDTQFAENKFAKRDPALPNKSTYLSVYRSLEFIPTTNMGKLNLVTRDGRMLSLEAQEVTGNIPSQPIYLYHELCPVRPLVVSSLEPIAFIKQVTNPANKVCVPRMALADIKVIDPDHIEEEGNIGSLYYAHIRHMKDVVKRIQEDPTKNTKILGRSRVETFGYQLIHSGIYIGDQEHVLFYRMKSRAELNRDHYAWAKSAQIV